MEKSFAPNSKYVAFCGLYCGSCGKFKKSACPGCAENEKATWCKIRSCCMKNGYSSCADCTLMPLGECKKFNNFIGKVFGLIFKSDRTACIERIKEIGGDEFAKEMQSAGLQSIKRQ